MYFLSAELQQPPRTFELDVYQRALRRVGHHWKASSACAEVSRLVLLEMKVKDVIGAQQLLRLDSGTSVAQAAIAMSERHVGAMLIYRDRSKNAAVLQSRR